MLIEVVEAEAPIHIDVAARRVSGAWGLSRVGHVVKKAVVDAAKTASRRGRLVLRHDFLYMPCPSAIPVRRMPVGASPRKAAHISPEEIAMAARLVLKDHLRLTYEDLIIGTARVLGFERAGSEVRTSVVGGIEDLIRSGSAELVNDDVVLR